MTRTRIALTGLALGVVVALTAWTLTPAAPRLSALDVAHLQTLAGAARDDAALRQLRVAAGNGLVAAQLALGHVLTAKPLPAQVTEGIAWLRKAVAAGSVEAQASLGKLYFRGTVGQAPDYAQAYTLLRAASEQNDAGASYFLALLYKNGLGVKPDSSAAAHWLERAADGNSAVAMFLLANMLLSGDGVRRDEQKARALIESAAAMEYPEAVQMMAIGLRDGSMGFVRDEKEASLQLLEVAHAMKHRPAAP
ncbi:MAG: tetratricopeptide repeat protein [Pseudomonadota bacterium]